MIIELDKIPAMWATCEKTVGARKDGMLDGLKELGITNPEQINCPLTRPYYVGLAMGHIEGLRRHKPPFLMLEDDARPVAKNWGNWFEIPDDTDALYLGTTVYGRRTKATVYNSVIAAETGSPYLRVYNMLALHAVVYVSKAYVDHVSKLMVRYVENPVGACDDLVADTMHHWKVIARKNPIFFQNDGKAERCTTEPIVPTFIELA